MPVTLAQYHAKHRSAYPPGWAKLERRTLMVHPFCAFCGEKKKLQVHHILPVHLHPELALEPTNIIVLCDACHFRFGHLGDYAKFWDPDIVESASKEMAYISQLRAIERG